MANAMKCDRCGCYYDHYGDCKTANSLCLQNLDIIDRCECDKKYDLCPDCMDIVKCWLTNPNRVQEKGMHNGA